MNPENVKFLIIMGCLLLTATGSFLWSWKTSKSEYQKMLENIKKGDNNDS